MVNWSCQSNASAALCVEHRGLLGNVICVTDAAVASAHTPMRGANACAGTAQIFGKDLTWCQYQCQCG